MDIFNIKSLPLWAIALLLAASAVVVWSAGTRLSRYADTIATRTGVGHVFIGVLMLGGVTSLPEIVTTITASTIGSASIAVNNLLGGVAMQTAVLVVADVAVGKQALSSMVKYPPLILQGVLLMLILALTICGVALYSYSFFGIGVWTYVIYGTFLFSFFLIKKYKNTEQAEGGRKEGGSGENVKEKNTKKEEVTRKKKKEQSFSTKSLILYTLIASVAILIGGYVAVISGEAISNKSGLGESIVGAVFIAIVTSLPELSTTLSAVRIKEYQLAFSNIFGANIFDISFLFIADLFYTEGPVLEAAGTFSQFAALLGIILTAVYMVGLIMKRKRSVLRMGYDSLLVLTLYISGLIILYLIK